jgi:hypothetical protein
MMISTTMISAVIELLSNLKNCSPGEELAVGRRRNSESL